MSSCSAPGGANGCSAESLTRSAYGSSRRSTVRIRWLAEHLAAGKGGPPRTPAAAGALAELVRHDDRDKAGDLVANMEKGDHEGVVKTIRALARRPALVAVPSGTQLSPTVRWRRGCRSRC